MKNQKKKKSIILQIPSEEFYQTQHKNSTSFNTNQTNIHIVHGSKTIYQI